MDAIAEDFIKSCLELGKELLDKENPTHREKEFLEALDIFTSKYIDKI